MEDIYIYIQELFLVKQEQIKDINHPLWLYF